MRVKSVLAPVGFVLVVALALPAVSNAERGESTTHGVEDETTIQEVDETPVEPVAEEPVVPVAEDPPAEPVAEEPKPVAEEPKPVEEPEPVVEEPKPVAEDPPAEPVAEEPPAEPVADAPPIESFVDEPPAQPVDGGKKNAKHADRSGAKQAGGCHMDSYESWDISTLDQAETARAEKVDRNDNQTVCRKDIPGNGRGNTGQGSNIKDDKVR